MLEKNVKYGFTFDDLLLLPGASEILPTEVDLSTLFCRDIELKLPLVSAAMDTVTESGTAVTMAHAGGLGVIHRNMTVRSEERRVGKECRSRWSPYH